MPFKGENKSTLCSMCSWLSSTVKSLTQKPAPNKTHHARQLLERLHLTRDRQKRPHWRNVLWACRSWAVPGPFRLGTARLARLRFPPLPARRRFPPRARSRPLLRSARRDWPPCLSLIPPRVYGSAVTPRWGSGGGLWLCAVAGEPEVAGSSPASAPHPEVSGSAVVVELFVPVPGEFPRKACLRSAAPPQRGRQSPPLLWGAPRHSRFPDSPGAQAVFVRGGEGAAGPHLERSGLGALCFATAAWKERAARMGHGQMASGCARGGLDRTSWK